ncbi:MAG: hypothetical protein GWP14_08220 [Actinobacteria bacterium]|nr:hypothetical protein [Actinomycetota bacterium]
MDNVDKNQMREHWLATYQTLSLLEDLHVWPVELDIADLEDELLEELDEIEYQLGQSCPP